MPLILGIDTGGTYTDGVIVDGDSPGKNVLYKAKALTTKDSLTVGIRNCIEGLGFADYGKINLVSLSTTLATNAIVEGKGCKVGLLLIGQLPDGKLPVEHFQVLHGRYDIRGKLLSSLREDECRKSIEHLNGKVDAVAVSGYASVRNPGHELMLKKIAREIMDVPIVCAHELTSSLGFYDRTVTAILNARLIPIITELISAVKIVLSEKSIQAPVMIVKGDGSLMEASSAQERPIETILSGPAASVISSRFLTGTDDAIILDMGGTTTDIANIDRGTVKIRKDGAMVGGWLTRVQSAEIYTYGLGGDSYLQLTADGNIKVGPQKVQPLCIAGSHYPHLLAELKDYKKPSGYELFLSQDCDCFMFLKEPAGMDLSPVAGKIISLLRKEPHSLFFLAQELGIDADSLGLSQLINLGIIGRIGLTPTDILHVGGRYIEWDTALAAAGTQIMADRMGKSLSDFVESIVKAVVDRLCFICLQSLARFENNQYDFLESEAAKYLIEKAFIAENRALFSATFSVSKPIIAIGAPVRSWLGNVAKKLNAELLIPEHAEVACAIGAAVGQVVESVKVLIRPGEGGDGYILHAPWERKLFDNLPAAIDYGIGEATRQAGLAAQKAGSREFEIQVENEDVFTDIFTSGKKIYIETRIKVTAVGRPIWGIS